MLCNIFELLWYSEFILAVRQIQQRIPNFLTNQNEYSDLPHNCAANLIIFREKNTYTTLLGPTRLLIFEIFPSKPDFHLYK